MVVSERRTSPVQMLRCRHGKQKPQPAKVLSAANMSPPEQPLQRGICYFPSSTGVLMRLLLQEGCKARGVPGGHMAELTDVVCQVMHNREYIRPRGEASVCSRSTP